LKALFLINTRSGTRRGYDYGALIRSECDWLTHELQPAPKQISDLDAMIAEAATQSFDVVFAVGGDGTVHEVAKRLIGTPLALGILPTGSGNGFARHLGFPAQARNALRAARGGEIATIDTAVVNGRPFVGVMGVGFDAYIADRFAHSTTRGMQTYVREGLAGFASYRAQDYELTIDGVASTPRAFVVAVANSSQYGNDARIAPCASLQDGLLDVVVIEPTSALRAPMLIARLFNGSLHRSSAVRTVQGKSVTIRRVSDGPAHLDGEPVPDLGSTLEVNINPMSLRVLVPAGRARL